MNSVYIPKMNGYFSVTDTANISVSVCCRPDASGETVGGAFLRMNTSFRASMGDLQRALFVMNTSMIRVLPNRSKDMYICPPFSQGKSRNDPR